MPKSVTRPLLLAIPVLLLAVAGWFWWGSSPAGDLTLTPGEVAPGKGDGGEAALAGKGSADAESLAQTPEARRLAAGELRPIGGAIRGRVVEAGTLKGVANVEVRAMRRHPGFEKLEERFRGFFRGGVWKDAREPVEVLAQAITQGDGGFDLTGIKAGNVFLDARSDRIFTRTPLQLRIASGEVRDGVELLGSVGGRVRGVVLGPNGPVADGHVHLRPGINAFLGQITDRRYRWLEASTNARGEFDLPGVPPGKGYVLSANGPTIALEEVYGIQVDEGQSVAVQVHAHAGARIQGIVVTPDGKPVAGANVAMMYLDFSRLLFSADGRTEPLTTGPDGSFAMERVAAGRVALTALDDSHAPAAVEELTLVDGGAYEGLRLELRDGRDVVGLVVDTDGAPIPGARVQARGFDRPDQPDLKLALNMRERAAETDAQGKFRISGIFERRLFLEARKPGFVSGRALDLKLDENPDIKITLLRGGAIAGVVVTGDASSPTPVPRFSVRVSSAPIRPQGPGSQSRPAEQDPRERFRERMRGRGPGGMGGGGDSRREEFADTSGQFKVDGVRPGKVTVTVEAEGFRTSEKQELELAAGETRDGLKFVLSPGGAVTGRVIDGPGGLPVGEAMVTARKMRDGDQRGEGSDEFPFRMNAQPEDFDFLGLAAGAGRGTVMTDPRGNFTVSGLEPGTYQLTARHPDHTKASVKSVTVTLESPLRGVEIALGDGGGIEGQVTGQGRRPLADAVMVAVSLQSGTLKSATTDQEGRYRLEHLPPGQYVVFKSRMEPRSDNIMFDLIGNMRLKNAAVKEGRMTRLDIQDETENGVAVWGYVRDGDKAVPRAMVSALASDKDGPFGIGMRADATDAAGKFELPSLVPGTYFVQVTAGGAGGRPWQTTLSMEVPEGAREFRFDILVPTSSITGFVRDSRGNPVERAVVRAGVVDGQDAPEGLMGMILRNAVGEARTGKDGRYELKRVAPGTYRLTASMQRFDRRDNEAVYGSALLDNVAVDGQTPLGNMDFSLPMAGRITGVAVDGNGTPVANAEIRSAREGEREAKSRSAFDLFGLQARTIKTDAQGRFAVGGLNPGTYAVTAELTGHTSGEQKGIVVAEGAETTLRLELVKGATLRVRILDLSGKNLPLGDVQVLNSKGEAVVKRYSAMELFRMAMRNKKEGDDTGWYEVGNVKPDTYTAVIRQKDKPELRVVRTIKDGEEVSWEVSMKELESVK